MNSEQRLRDELARLQRVMQSLQERRQRASISAAAGGLSEISEIDARIAETEAQASQLLSQLRSLQQTSLLDTSPLIATEDADEEAASASSSSSSSSSSSASSERVGQQKRRLDEVEEEFSAKRIASSKPLSQLDRDLALLLVLQTEKDVKLLERFRGVQKDLYSEYGKMFGKPALSAELQREFLQSYPNETDLLDKLFRKNSDLKANNNAALKFCSLMGYSECVRRLLAANVDAEDETAVVKAFENALENKHEIVARMLLQREALRVERINEEKMKRLMLRALITRQLSLFRDMFSKYKSNDHIRSDVLTSFYGFDTLAFDAVGDTKTRKEVRKELLQLMQSEFSEEDFETIAEAMGLKSIEFDEAFKETWSLMAANFRLYREVAEMLLRYQFRYVMDAYANYNSKYCNLISKFMFFVDSSAFDVAFPYTMDVDELFDFGETMEIWESMEDTNWTAIVSGTASSSSSSSSSTRTISLSKAEFKQLLNLVYIKRCFRMTEENENLPFDSKRFGTSDFL